MQKKHANDQIKLLLFLLPKHKRSKIHKNFHILLHFNIPRLIVHIVSGIIAYGLILPNNFINGFPNFCIYH